MASSCVSSLPAALQRVRDWSAPCETPFRIGSFPDSRWNSACSRPLDNSHYQACPIPGRPPDPERSDTPAPWRPVSCAPGRRAFPDAAASRSFRPQFANWRQIFETAVPPPFFFFLFCFLTQRNSSAFDQSQPSRAATADWPDCVHDWDVLYQIPALLANRASHQMRLIPPKIFGGGVSALWLPSASQSGRWRRDHAQAALLTANGRL